MTLMSSAGNTMLDSGAPLELNHRILVQTIDAFLKKDSL